MDRYQQKIEDVTEQRFNGDIEALAYLGGVCGIVQKGHRAVTPVIDRIANIASRYSNPVGALKILYRKFGSYKKNNSLDVLDSLYSEDETILLEHPSLSRLSHRSLDFRLEEIMYGAHMRSYNCGRVRNRIAHIHDEASPAQEKAIRELEEAR